MVACPIWDTLITRIPADEEPLCGKAAVYAVIIIIIITCMSVQLLCLYETQDVLCIYLETGDERGKGFISATNKPRQQFKIRE